jgi:hypothetical protein
MAPPTKRARGASDSDEDYREDSDNDIQSACRSTRHRKQARGSLRIEAITKKRKEQEKVKLANRLVGEVENDTQPLLRLPGEIRNTIYDFLIPDDDIPLMHDPYLSEEIDWDGATSGRALTQTCRRLRAEFLRLYKRKSNINIPLVDLEHYKDTWLSSIVGPMPGRLTLSLKRNSPRNETDRGTGPRKIVPPVNISRLIRMRHDLPGFRFFVESHNVVPPIQLEGDPLPPKADIRFLEPDMDMVKMVLKQDNVGWELQFHFHTKPEKYLSWLVEDDLYVFSDGARDDLHY